MLIDFLSFIKVSSQQLSFKNQKLLSTFQSDWFTLFLEVTPSTLVQKSTSPEEEIFDIPLHFEGTEATISFNIDQLINELQKRNFTTNTINTQQFLKHTYFNKTKLLENRHLISYALKESFHSVKNEPIIILSTNFTYPTIVLDGNHRVDFAVKNQIPSLQAYTIDSQFLVSRPHLFSNQISYLIFCFLEDIANLDRSLHEKHAKGFFGILQSEALLLKQHSILPVVQEYIFGKYH
ncbi:hypothetical protein [Streptococcus dysgalactiae]|uniref:hypothetical protein n=1 Tax=Streptococcus dysgalactiae TaxID=1334 RepID=UPI0024B71040|nr:hypothetical protein [Streptococcus dysgalactiae]